MCLFRSPTASHNPPRQRLTQTPPRRLGNINGPITDVDSVGDGQTIWSVLSPLPAVRYTAMFLSSG